MAYALIATRRYQNRVNINFCRDIAADARCFMHVHTLAGASLHALSLAMLIGLLTNDCRTH